MLQMILSKLHALQELLQQETGQALIESFLITAFLVVALISGVVILTII
jgi:hypothetical protein